MENDSATGGPLLPVGVQPLEGLALNRFLQGWVVGLLGIDPTLVRPQWQAEPPNMPPPGTAWVALGVPRVTPFYSAFQRHEAAAYNGAGADYIQRGEELELLLSFYDLGVAGTSSDLAGQFVAGLQVPQNRELLTRQFFALVESRGPTAVPDLFRERWIYRLDCEVRLVRTWEREYAVRSLLKGQGDIHTDAPPTTTHFEGPADIPPLPPLPQPGHGKPLDWSSRFNSGQRLLGWA